MKNLILLSLVTFTFFACGSDESNDPAPAITITASNVSTSIDENPENGDVIETISASTSSGTLSYSVQSQTPSGAFAVNVATGELTVANASLFDFETYEYITGKVKIISGEAQKVIDVTIDINDVTDRAFKSIDLDGSDDYISLGDVAEYNQMTVSAWIKTSVGNTRIVSKFGSVWQYELKITSGGQLEFGVGLNDDSFPVTQGGSNLTDNNWHHVAATWDGTTTKLYVDGALVNSGTATGTMRSGTDPVLVGSWNGSNEFFDGLLTEVSLWDTALNGSWMLALYSNCRALTGNETNLKFLLDFGTSSGSAITIANSESTVAFNGGASASFVTTMPCE